MAKSEPDVFTGDVESLKQELAEATRVGRHYPVRRPDGSFGLPDATKLEHAEETRPLLLIFGKWLEGSLTHNAANIYLIIETLKKGGNQHGN